MKKLLVGLALMSAFATARADTPCWVIVGDITINVRHISTISVLGRDKTLSEPYVYIAGVRDTIAKIRVPTEADGKKLVQQIIALSQGCK